jgi:hypothetical protein
MPLDCGVALAACPIVGMTPTTLNLGPALAWLDVACAQHAGLNATNKRKYVTTRNMSVSLVCSLIVPFYFFVLGVKHELPNCFYKPTRRARH